MIQDILPHCLDLAFPGRPPADGDFVVALKGGQALFADDGGGRLSLPEYGALRRNVPNPAERLIFLFHIGGAAVHYAEGGPIEAPGHIYADIMRFRDFTPPDWRAFAGVTACHLAQWYAANRFCGACAAAMRRKSDERALQCPACGQLSYPRISPAVIVGIIDRDRILMTRYANRPGARLGALIAGFLEVGETLEDTVRREVFEEVGLRVGNIRYYKSQPWAFSGSVLTGFYADLEGSDKITLDTTELAEARWIARADIAPGPDGISLTSEMIEVFRAGKMP